MLISSDGKNLKEALNKERKKKMILSMKESKRATWSEDKMKSTSLLKSNTR